MPALLCILSAVPALFEHINLLSLPLSIKAERLPLGCRVPRSTRWYLQPVHMREFPPDTEMAGDEWDVPKLVYRKLDREDGMSWNGQDLLQVCPDAVCLHAHLACLSRLRAR